MSARISSATYWAAISPSRRGRRWIHYDSLRTTKRASREAFIGASAVAPYNSWAHWEREGWTIERVFLTAVQMAPAE